MQVSCAWLREWVSGMPAARDLAERLTLGGLEVESILPAAMFAAKNNRGDVVVGEIVRIAQHPGAAKLQLCEVDIGRKSSPKNLEIACGADNARLGMKVAVAMVGATLPQMTIAEKTIGGRKSSGMICSAAELGLQETSSGASNGVMELDADAPCGKLLTDYLDLADDILSLELTPNRGDCLGLLGIAREVCALSGAKMRTDIHRRRISGTIKKIRATDNTKLPIELRAPEQCPRYVGRAVRNINMRARTPDWMAERLRRGGVRGINAVVDITNYVMLELGQPMHAFDLEKLDGGIIVRTANAGEELQLLDGNTVKLRADNLLIADHKKAVALGGIMGGQNSAIGDATRHIYFEAAYFPASAIIGKARQFGMHTDASHRFERGADPDMQLHAIERATELLIAIAGGEPAAVGEACAAKYLPTPVQIQLNQNDIARNLGIDVPPPKVRDILTRLGMTVSANANANKGNRGGWKVAVPTWRADITAAHDLVEEIGRVHGFDKIAPRKPAATATVGAHPENRVSVDAVKSKLIERGYCEAITYSFVAPDLQTALCGERGIELQNPIADNLSVMRCSLWPGLVEAVRANRNRRHERIRLFETGHVFFEHEHKHGSGNGNGKRNPRREIARIAAVAAGAVLPVQWGFESRAADFFDLKGDLIALLALSKHRDQIEFHPAAHPALHPGRCAQLALGGKVIGHLGQLHPAHQQSLDIDLSVCLFELDLAVLGESRLPQFTAVSRHPAVRRDLAIVVEAQVSAQKVLDVARQAAGELLVDAALFDVYHGAGIEKGHKSFALRLTFQSKSSNLTATQADGETDKILTALRRQFNARLRA